MRKCYETFLFFERRNNIQIFQYRFLRDFGLSYGCRKSMKILYFAFCIQEIKTNPFPVI